ncbi:hypothetical protein L1987_81356 [Smallanthus sonchifolius]|uniref:Uncharacterized protein n=1 Tax=Smallanthus sonchifolius TaxID=185202 RepID=A0ACB8YRC7_9ASTR|nr:hypothetical protein L1987_81356 [Smallanthus sonchifolius]
MQFHLLLLLSFDFRYRNKTALHSRCLCSHPSFLRFCVLTLICKLFLFLILENMLKLGPKLMEGSIWDERGKTGVAQILISHQEAMINSIQFIYRSRAEVSHSKIYGEPDGLKFDLVTFDHPDEFLTSVAGEFGDDGIASLSFSTNNRTYGPFGGFDTDAAPTDYFYKKFKYNFELEGSFQGFHGSVKDSRVYAIGIFVQPIEAFSFPRFI